MAFDKILIAGVISIFAGIDRTAMWQFMLSRPIVAAPLIGLLLGEPATGLLVGGLVELLWLGRLPVGAAIPPDDTQVAIGGTALAVIVGQHLQISGPAFTLLAVIIALPLGKVGQVFDRMARLRNGRLLEKVNAAVLEGRLEGIDRLHLMGIGHFALSSLATFTIIFVSGTVLLSWSAPVLLKPVEQSYRWLALLLPCVGAGSILGTVNVSRKVTLFTASFITVFLTLWLL